MRRESVGSGGSGAWKGRTGLGRYGDHVECFWGSADSTRQKSHRSNEERPFGSSLLRLILVQSSCLSRGKGAGAARRLVQNWVVRPTGRGFTSWGGAWIATRWAPLFRPLSIGSDPKTGWRRHGNPQEGGLLRIDIVQTTSNFRRPPWLVTAEVFGCGFGGVFAFQLRTPQPPPPKRQSRAQRKLGATMRPWSDCEGVS